MVKLSGRVRIEFTDLEGRKTRSPVEQSNVIFSSTLRRMLAYDAYPIFNEGSSTAIALIGDSSAPDPGNPNWTDQIATGYIASGVTSPIWYESVTPNFGEIQNRIDAPSTPRTFYSVGLVGYNARLCRTLLTIPCTQNLFEVLNIYYQIQVENTSGQRLSSRFTRDFGGRLFGQKYCTHHVLGTSYCDVPTQAYIDIQQNSELITNNFQARQWDSTNIVNSHYKYKESVLFQIRQSGISGNQDECVGYIFNSMLTGQSNYIGANEHFVSAYTEGTNSAYRISKYKSKTVNIDPNIPVFQPPFQKIWTHRAGSSVPFFDVSNAAIGSSYPTTYGTWTGRWPELYKFSITAGGDMGKATYNFSKRLHLGFNGNAYSDRTVICPFRNPNTPAAAGMHGWRYEDNDLLRWSNTQMVQYDHTGVTLLDLTNGAYQNWDATTTPSLPVTALYQSAVDPTNNLIYCACRNTGLWIINVATNTINQAVNSACYGVDVGRNNVAFAIFEGSLRKSTDWSTALTFVYTGLSDGHWGRAYFLKVDPSNVNDQMAIVIDSPDSPGNNRRIVWYDARSLVTSTGFDNPYVFQWAASLDVSEKSGFWAIYQFKLFFGNANLVYIATVTGQQVAHSVWGNQHLYKIAFYNEFLITYGGLVDANNATQNSYSVLGDSAALLHMQGGIVVMSNAVRQLFTDNNYCYDSYGWDGNKWVLGGTGSKTTHTDAQPLIEGLQIAWTQGANPPLFQTGDFYTQGICNGTWKDNATTIYFENFWYTRPVYFDVAIPTGVIVPSGLTYALPATSSPEFYLIETDSINELASFMLNGAPVATIYVNGESPGSGEVSVNGATGAVTFNSANQGQTFAGTYAWIGS